MTQLPTTLDEAIAQAKAATTAALNDGYTRLQVELVFPEIQLQAQSIAEQFIPLLQERGLQLKVFFPDTGAAALARRDWGEVPFKIADLGTSRSPVESRLEPEDELFLLVSPSAVEVLQVQSLCNAVGDRPVILLNPRMEDVTTIGIGYAGRQLRDRFLNTIESCYYLRPLEGAALLRSYPAIWQVWLETKTGFQLITEQAEKPVGDALEQILLKATTPQADAPQTVQPKRKGFLSNLQSFLRALSQ